MKILNKPFTNTHRNQLTLYYDYTINILEKTFRCINQLCIYFKSNILNYSLLVCTRHVFGTPFTQQIRVLFVIFAIASISNNKAKNSQIVILCCLNVVSANGKTKSF